MIIKSDKLVNQACRSCFIYKVAYGHVKSRRFPACLLNPSFAYSGKRPSYIMLSSP